MKVLNEFLSGDFGKLFQRLWGGGALLFSLPALTLHVDCEKFLIFLMSHSISKVRVKEERRSRSRGEEQIGLFSLSPP